MGCKKLFGGAAKRPAKKIRKPIIYPQIFSKSHISLRNVIEEFLKEPSRIGKLL